MRLLQKQGKTILIAEHRLYYLMDLADRIVYLEQGRIEKVFTPEEFRGLPREARERMGIAAADLGGGAASASPLAGIFPCPGASECHAPV